MKKLLVIDIFIISAISLITLKFAWAEDKIGYLQGVEFLSGFGQGQLIQKKDYRVVPVAIALDYNIKSLTEKIGFKPPSLVQFQIEPFFSLVTNPQTNMEVGASFLLKFGLLPEDWSFQPYVKAGTGMVYMTQHTLDQSTQLNSLVICGAGLHYFLKEDSALTIEYRFRHLSNSSVKQPNRGIDVHFYLLGITRLF